MKNRLPNLIGIDGCYNWDDPPQSAVTPEPLRPHVTSKDARIVTDAHYSDPRFHNPPPSLGYRERTVFGEDRTGLRYEYSDRLFQWDPVKYRAAVEVASGKPGVKERTARWFEEYLSEYLGHRVNIVHIIAGVNQSNGYSYLIYGFEDLDTPSQQ
ncbi:MAG: hypothetical protein WC718_00410 [Phycisphaerales bacterium]|jgi:hypothetical protein